MAGQTPWQTTGPFFHFALPWKGCADLTGDSELGARADLTAAGHDVLTQHTGSLRHLAKGERIELVGGSFFDRVPPADLYTLKQILHDWSDDDCMAILKSIRDALLPGGRVVLIDHILSDEPEANEAQGTDIAMLVWATGRERRLGEFAALSARSGFEIARHTRNSRGHSAIDLVPA